MVYDGLFQKQRFLYLLIVSGTPGAGKVKNRVIRGIRSLLLAKDHSQTILNTPFDGL